MHRALVLIAAPIAIGVMLGIGLPQGQTALSYYLAEGATGSFFDYDLAIANPNTTAAPITVRFLKEDGTTVTQAYTIPPGARRTYRVDNITGVGTNAVSTVVTSTNGLPLLVERSMFGDAGYYMGHGEQALTNLSRHWYFAEGSQGYFSTYFLLTNPSSTAATVTLQFLTEFRGAVTKTYTLPGTSRVSVYAGDIRELVDESFSTVVQASHAIIVERAMYFGTGRLWEGAHESAGVPEPNTTWFHAEGATGSFFETFILIGNPNTTPANVSITYLLDTGTSVTRTHTLAPSSRLTVNVEAEDPLS
jgi:BarA-like signal transduction histidine kinase